LLYGALVVTLWRLINCRIIIIIIIIIICKCTDREGRPIIHVSYETCWISVFQQSFLWSGTLCSNFDCSRNPRAYPEICLREIVKFEAEGPQRERGSWK